MKRCSKTKQQEASIARIRLLYLVFLPLFIMSFSPLQAQECTFYGDSPPDPLRGSIDTPGGGFGIEASHEHLFVLGIDYLTSVDYSDPDQLEIRSSVNTGIGENFHFTLSDDFAYVVGDTNHFKIFDISNPADLSFVGETQTTNGVNGVVGYQNYAYLTIPYQIEIMNVSDPSAPSLIATVPTAGNGGDLTIYGAHLFVAGDNVLEAFDISNPINPVHEDSLFVGSDCIAIDGQYAFVANGISGLSVIDISNPTQMTIVGQIDIPFAPRQIAVENDRAYLTGNSDGVQVVDITDPTEPFLVWNYSTLGVARDVAVVDDLLFVADGDPAVQVIDLATPFNPDAWVSSSGLNSARQVAAEGPFAFVVESISGETGYALVIHDLADPSDPVARGSLGLSSSVRDLKVLNRFVYFVDDYFRLVVCDATEPDQPVLTDEVSLPGYGRSVAVAGNIALAGSTYSDYSVLSIFDISDPYDVVFLGSVETPDNAEEIVLSDQKAYLAADDEGLLVVDISSPDSPVILGQWPTTQSWGVAVSGNYAYVADWDWGLVIVDVSDPEDLQQVAALDIAGVYEDKVVVAGGHAYVSFEGGTGFAVVDISDPFLPVLVTVYETANNCGDIFTDGKFIYTAGGDTYALNLYLLQCGNLSSVPGPYASDSSVLFLENFPNPFNPTTQIKFELPEAGLATLKIYDVRGLHIRTLLSKQAVEKRGIVTWDGRDDRGQQMPSGTYFYRLEAGEFSETKKMTLLK